MKIVIFYDGGSRPYNLDSFRKDQVSFGRSSDCDIQIKKDYISRVHGYFRKLNGIWYIQDNQSTNGIVYKIGRASCRERV